MVVDWPWASIGAAWVDLLVLLPSVAGQGGPQSEALFQRHPVAHGVDPDAVTTVLAGLAGYLVRESRQPPPPGLPTLRAFQHSYSRPALAWLRQRTRLALTRPTRHPEHDQDPPGLLAGGLVNSEGVRTLDLPITSRMLGVDLDGSRRI
jgi:hypothetical protein